MSRKRKKISKKQRLMRIFFRTIVITLAVIGIGVAAFSAIYNKFILGDSIGSILEKEKDPINKTLAVFGVDEDGYRTDVIFVVNYNSETQKTRIISVPRDTKVEWDSEMRTKMEALKGYSVSISKINEMTSYVGIDNITEFTIPQIEEILDVQIDNYVIITLSAFREIVDAVGGVEVDVPALDGDGLHYDDNAQDLHIHLSPGVQTLNGEEAEGLVRFRKGYAEGDVGRIKTQQLFLEGLFNKITSPQIITKVPAIVNAVLKTVTTDIKLSEISEYTPYLKSLGESNLKCDIIPGESSYQNSKSYFIPDEAAMPAFIQEMLYGNDTNEESTEVIIDQTVSIEVLNSTDVNGLAGKAKETLEASGYQVASIGNYTSNVLPQTTIYVKDRTLGAQFLAYYPDATIIQSEQIPYDVQIVLGNDSAE